MGISCECLADVGTVSADVGAVSVDVDAGVDTDVVIVSGVAGDGCLILRFWGWGIDVPLMSTLVAVLF